MVVTLLVHVGLLVSAWQKRYISEKYSKMKVFSFPKSGPSVRMCFRFLASFELEWTKRLCSRRMERMEIRCYVTSWSKIGAGLTLLGMNCSVPADKFPIPRFRRRRFHVQVYFAMKINKAQGQSVTGSIGLYLISLRFSHGQ